MTYHDVESNHGVEHISDVPYFNAKNPYIHVSILEDDDGNYKTDWDVKSCSSFIEEKGKWASCRPGLELPV